MSGGETPDRIARRMHVKGKVQGVWFRAWTIEQASELGLDGWVRNRHDGSVEAVAAGAPDRIDELFLYEVRANGDDLKYGNNALAGAPVSVRAFRPLDARAECGVVQRSLERTSDIVAPRLSVNHVVGALATCLPIADVDKRHVEVRSLDDPTRRVAHQRVRLGEQGDVGGVREAGHDVQPRSPAIGLDHFDHASTPGVRIRIDTNRGLPQVR